MKLFDRVCLSVGVLSVAVVVVALRQMADRLWVLVVGSATLVVGLTSAWWAVRRGRW